MSFVAKLKQNTVLFLRWEFLDNAGDVESGYGNVFGLVMCALLLTPMTISGIKGPSIICY